MDKLVKQIVKFGMVGISALAIDYSIMIFLIEVFHIDYLISNGISFVASVIFNYIMSVKWVFDVEKNREKKQEILVFVVLSTIGLGINQLLMWLTVEKLRIFYMISKIGATIVVMVYNFVTRKLFLENKND